MKNFLLSVVNSHFFSTFVSVMTEKFEFTSQEKEEILSLYNSVKQAIAPSLTDDDEEKMRHYLISRQPIWWLRKSV